MLLARNHTASAVRQNTKPQRMGEAMRTMIAAAAVAALPLAGCQTTEQIEAANAATCESYGAVPGTPAYAQCRIALRQVAEQRAAARRAHVDRVLADYQRQQRATQARRFTCTSTGYGDTVTTNCY